MTNTLMDFDIDNHYSHRHGDSFWMIGLPDGRELSCHADTVEVTDGALIISGGYHRDGDQDDDPPTPKLILAAGSWTHAYAASMLDGSPVAVQTLQRAGRTTR